MNDSPAPQLLGVLTCNLGLNARRLLGRRLPASSGLEQRFEAAPRLLRAFDADVIALQEVYDAADRRQLLAALGDLYPYAVVPGGRRSLLGNGLLLLSRFPVRGRFVSCRSAFIAQRFLWDAGFLVAELTVPSLGAVRLINLHLAAGAPFHHPEAAATKQHRSREIAELLTLARQGGDGALLAGDFNASPEICPENYQEIIDAGYVDAFAACNGAADGTAVPTWDAANPLNRVGPHRHSPSQRIDHVFVPRDRLSALSPLSARIVLREPAVELPGGGSCTLSDHYGLLVSLALCPTEARVLPAMPGMMGARD
jgi:endonuclease/exonuclease/phosphatase family metal-dependent hydrolase